MCKVHSIELSKLFTLKSCVVVHAQQLAVSSRFLFKPFYFARTVCFFATGEVGAEPQNNKEEGNWTKWFMQRIELEFKRFFSTQTFESCGSGGNERSDLSIFTDFEDLF